MKRTQLPNRRPNATVSIEWSGHIFTVTVGFDPETGRILEVFADRPKIDGMSAILSDACVWASIAMQHGVTPAELAKSLGEVPVLGAPKGATGPASPLGAIVEAILSEVRT